MKRSLFTAAACFVAAAWVAACSDSNGTGESPVATTIQMIGGDQQEGIPGAALADSLVVRVVDGNGNGVGGVSVKFVVTSGGGSVSPANATTNAAGYAAAEWVLGRTFDAQAVEARAEGLDGSPIEFTAKVIEPSTVAIGDTVLGMISAGGEVDAFTLVGTEGQEFNIFFQPLSGSNTLVLEFYQHYGTANQLTLKWVVAGESSDLQDHHTGRIMLPADGTYTIAVRGDGADYTGPYRFYIFPIDRNPESVPALVAVGDTIEGESISPKSDIDVFTFEGTAGEEIEIYFQPLQQPAGTVQLRVVEYHSRPSGRVIGGANGSAANDQQWASSGRIALPYDGTYSIMIVDLYDGYEGAYRFHIAPIDRNPESVPSTVAIGDTIEGESINPGATTSSRGRLGRASRSISSR